MRPAYFTWEKQMNRKSITAAIILAFAPGVVFAEMNYSGVELSFISIDLGDDLVDVDGDGFELFGSYAMSDKYFLFGEYSDQDLGFGLDGRSIEFGAGLNHELNNDLDFVASASYIDAKVRVGNFSVSDDGLALGAGVRAKVARKFEVEGGVRYIDLDQSGSDTGFVLGGRYYFNDTFALSAGTDLNDNADTFRIGFRAEF
jgi:opacity protein-like surface antigen